ncbi:MAG: ABC transporter ATP-binding protein, partial [SAR324 cluster bacterium]|nr:ABC transporter ATP-binding protein [SAR324 cluster bacterium]
THDLGVIAQVADRVSVMYLGRIVESGPVREVLHSPAHPYTRSLLNSLPKLDALDEELTPIPGDIPSPLERPSGCVFHTRCREAIDGRCSMDVPLSIQVASGHEAACFLNES